MWWAATFTGVGRPAAVALGRRFGRDMGGVAPAFGGDAGRPSRNSSFGRSNASRNSPMTSIWLK